ncbi:hypothetical protein OROHE_008880 [Orobanche hederae]
MSRILVFKIRPSQEILKIRDDTHLEAEEILTYRKSPRNGSVWRFSGNLDVPSNVLQKKRVARILVFKIRPSQEIHKTRDGTPLEAEEILTYRKKPSKWTEILKIRDGTPLEAEEILTYRKSPRNGSVWRFFRNLDVPSNVLQKKRVARILVFKIRPSQKILKIRDGTHLEAEKILTYRKSPRNGPVWRFSRNLDVPSNVLQKKIVARIMVFKIRPSQEILKIRDDTHLEAEEILTYRKSPRNGSVWRFSGNLDVPSNVLQKKRVARILKKRVARILVFKIWPSQEILKIRDGTPLEAEEILIYRKSPRNGSTKRVSRILVFKIRPSQEILKIRDDTHLEAEEILTYRKSPRNGSVWRFSGNLDVPSNVLQKKRVARILVFKIRPSQEIHKTRDGTPLEMSSQEILKIRDGTPLEAEEILTYRKSPRNGSVWRFFRNLDVPSNVLQKKRVARILVFKIRPSQKILKIRDGTHLEAEKILTYRKSPRNGPVWRFSRNLDVPSNVLQKKIVARILAFKIWPSQEILKIRDGTPLEMSLVMYYRRKEWQGFYFSKFGHPKKFSKSVMEEILTYRKSPRNGPVWRFSRNLDVPSNVLQKKIVARILAFKIWPSQEILKIRDGTPLEMSSQEILKIRDGTPLEAEEILTYRKSPRNGSVWRFFRNLDVPSNVLQKKRVARILVFKIRPSQ